MENMRWVMARPSGGQYDPGCFQLKNDIVRELADGQVLIESLLLSLDPTNLNWAKLDPALQYLPIGVGDPMVGVGIGRVVKTRTEAFRPGQFVTGPWAWEKYALADPALLQPALDPSVMPFEDQLAILSHIGLAAAGGIICVGEVKPTDAVLVSAAAGATGSIAAQIAKAKGCYTVGIAGGADKCRYLIEELGLDHAIDYRAEPLAAAVARHFPHGVDLFFDNVGGEVLDVVLENMAQSCRIAICGAISQYDVPDPAQFYGIKNLPMLIFRQGKLEGYLANQFGDRSSELLGLLLELYRAGRLKVRQHVIEGFENIPEALLLLLQGRNTGKLMARV